MDRGNWVIIEQSDAVLMAFSPKRGQVELRLFPQYITAFLKGMRNLEITRQATNELLLTQLIESEIPLWPSTASSS